MDQSHKKHFLHWRDGRPQRVVNKKWPNCCTYTNTSITNVKPLTLLKMYDLSRILFCAIQNSQVHSTTIWKVYHASYQYLLQRGLLLLTLVTNKYILVKYLGQCWMMRLSCLRNHSIHIIAITTKSSCINITNCRNSLKWSVCRG